MKCLLGPIFEPGTYDMLRKNCNTFSASACVGFRSTSESEKADL